MATSSRDSAGRARSTQRGSVSNKERIRAFKRRASKACQSCRDRKVRCDVQQHGRPCTNCTLDEVYCSVPESRRSNRPRISKRDHIDLSKNITPHESESPTVEEIVEEPTIPGQKRPRILPGIQEDDEVHTHERRGSALAPQRPHESLVPPPSAPLSPTPSGSTSSEDELLERDSAFEPHLIYETLPANETIQCAASELAPQMFTSPSTSHSFIGANTTPQAGYSGSLHQEINFSLPPYIEPLPSRVSLEDVDYLQRKGALMIPTAPFLTSLLRSYVEFVHPYFPLIELERFLMAIETGTGENGKISLLLMQAALFAASAFVNAECLSDAGFVSRKVARKTLFERTRLLYDLDIERDHIILIQSLLLMSYWFERPENPRNTTQYISLAVSLSQGIGLHRNPYKANSRERQKLRKRIWWCAFMRDRLAALATSRPTRIGTNDSDVPMLTVDDFEILNLPEGLSCVPDCTYLRNPRMARQLAQCCVEMTKLCVCIGHVLAVHHSLPHNIQGCATPKLNTRAKMILLASNLAGSELPEVRRCDEELIRWASELDEDVLYSRPTGPNFDECLTVHKARLLLLYFAATLCALHRSLAQDHGCFLSPNSRSTELREIAVRKARLAAREISRICKDLFDLNLVRFLPTSGVTSVVLASIIHLRDVKSEDCSIRNTAVESFSHCMQVIHGLADNYYSAQFAVSLMEQAVRKLKHKPAAQSNDLPDILSTAALRRPAPVNSSPMGGGMATAVPTDAEVMDPLAAMENDGGPGTLTEEEIARQLSDMFASMPSDTFGSNQTLVDVNPSSYFLPTLGVGTDGNSRSGGAVFPSNENLTSPMDIEGTTFPFHW